MSSTEESVEAAAHSPLGLRQYVGYGIGCFGTDVFWQATSFFLLFYYTDVLGIPSISAGLIFMIALIWDAVTDPAMGVIAVKTQRLVGGYRRWMALGAIPLAIAFIFMFAQPFIVTEPAAVFWVALGSQLLFRTTFTAVAIPYGSLAARITSDSNQRSVLAAYRVIFGLAAGLVVAFATLYLVGIVGGGDARKGFFLVSLMYAAVGAIMLVITYFTVEESVDLDIGNHPSAFSILRMLATNRPFQVVVTAIVLLSVTGTLSGKTIVYYFKYYVGEAELGGVALAMTLAIMVLLTPLWSLYARRTSKRSAWIAGSCLAALASFALYFYLGREAGVTLIVLSFVACGTAALPVTLWSIVPDTVEVGEFTSGIRAEGAIYGSITLAQKTGLALGAGLVGFLLDGIGYTPNVEQSEQTLQGFHVLMSLAPAAGMIMGAGIMIYYRLDRTLHARLVRALDRRHARAG